MNYLSTYFCFKQIFFPELGVEIEMQSNGRKYEKRATENINKLLRKLFDMNKQQKHIILLIDEVVINYDDFDFSLLQLMYPFIHILIAINPAGFSLTKAVKIISPSGSNVLAVQLMTKHRNSFQIALLLAHANKFFNDEEDSYKCLDASEDNSLESSKLPSGPLPIWIQRSQESSDVEILDYLKAKFLHEVTNVTLVVSPLRQPFSQEADSWLNKERWKTSDFHTMTGSETETLVAFIDDNSAVMELLSRAKRILILVLV